VGEHLGSYLWLIKGMWGSSLIVVVVLGGVILCVQVPYASRRRWGYSAAWMAGWRLRSTAEPARRDAGPADDDFRHQTLDQ